MKNTQQSGLPIFVGLAILSNDRLLLSADPPHQIERLVLANDQQLIADADAHVAGLGLRVQWKGLSHRTHSEKSGMLCNMVGETAPGADPPVGCRWVPLREVFSGDMPLENVTRFLLRTLKGDRLEQIPGSGSD